MASARAIVLTLLLIGVSGYFFERISTILSYSDNDSKEVKLRDVQNITSDEPFLLTDFYYKDTDLKILDGKQSKALVLYADENDSIAIGAIEISKKIQFQKEM